MITRNTAWCGIDISKKTLDAAFYSSTHHLEVLALPTRSFPRNPDGMLALYDWIETQQDPTDTQVRVIMEATGAYSLETVTWILTDHPELQPAVVNPFRASAYHTSLGLRNKSDKIDCRSLARMGKDQHPSAYQPLSPIREMLRALTRQRTAIVEQRTAAKNRRSEMPSVPFTDKLQDKLIQYLTKAIEKIEKELHRLIQTDDRIKADMALLQSILGVGFITAITAIAELGDLSVFKCSRQITCMVGLSPLNRTSGTCVRKRPRMSKQGNVQLRAVLYMAARTAALYNPQMIAVYTRMRERGKCHKSALGVVMRKLLVLMRALIISRENYDPKWQPSTTH